MIHLPKYVLKKSIKEQFKWIIKQQPDNLLFDQYIFKAYELGTKLIGFMFSEQEMRKQISNYFPFISDSDKYRYNKQNREYIQKKILSNIKDCIYLENDQFNQINNVEYRTITSLSEVEVNPDVVTLLRAPMGIGKTKVVGTSECKKHNKQVLAICHRITLVQELSHILGLTYYQDEMFNETVAPPSSKKAPKKGGLDLSILNRCERQTKKSDNGLATCINSINKAKDQLSSTPELLLIDEISQVLDTILLSSTINFRHKVYSSVKDYLKNTNYILGMDANLSNKDVNAIQILTNKKIIIYNLEKDDSCMNINIYSEKYAGHLLLEYAINRKQPFVFCSDNKSFIHTAHALLKKKGLKGLTITGDNKHSKSEIMAGLNEYIEENKPDYLLYSPAISSGVSITTEHFEHIYCTYHLIIPPTDLMQMLKRVRTIHEVSLAITKTSGGLLDDVQAIKNGYQNIRRATDNEIESDELLNQKIKYEAFFSAQLKYAPYSLYKSMISRKWKVNFQDPDNNNDNKEEITEEINQLNKLHKEQFITNVINAYQLPETENKEHTSDKLSDEFTDQYKEINTFMRHITLTTELNKEDVILLKNNTEQVKQLIKLLIQKQQK